MKIVSVCLWLVLSLACKKDEDASNCQRLEGVWQCESWKEDGEEFLGGNIFITGAELTFQKLDGDGGDYTWEISYLIGGTEMIDGIYFVNESCDEVTVTPMGGASTTYGFTISDDELTLAENINGVEIELQFRKE